MHENYLKISICKCLIQQLRITVVLMLAQSVVCSPAVTDCHGQEPEVLTQPKCLSAINAQVL